MYRRKTAFQKASIRDKKRIISAIMRKMLWMIGFLLCLLIACGVYYQSWEFIVFSVFFLFPYGMIWVYKRIKRRELRAYFTIEQLQRMSPKNFEIFVVELFNTLGYDLECVGQAGDQGIDGIGKDPSGNEIIIQTKRYKDINKILPKDIREFIGTLEFHGIGHGIYVTTGFGTQGIHDYIREHKNKKIIFVDKDRLVELIHRAYRSKK